jgi:transcriptional regulator with XRE-family HTH domain
MSKNINRVIEPINWQEIVKVAKLKRKEEGLTQKAHASLAGVSIPTIISFDNAETTLSVQKALDILKVVNMVAKKSCNSDRLTEFALNAKNKWQELISSLPEDSLAVHPFGYYTYTFSIEGPLKTINIQGFKKILEEVSRIKYSGWSPFWVPQSEDIAPYVNDDNNIECWLGNKYLAKKRDKIFPSPEDFWCASSSGLMYLQRAYREDCSLELLKPGTILDINLPIRNITEIICYADRLRRAISLDAAQSSVNLHILYTGLKGRKLANWTNPTHPIFEETTVSMSNEVDIAAKFSLTTLPYDYKEIARIANAILNKLYSKFNFFQLQDEFIENKVKQTLSKHF